MDTVRTVLAMFLTVGRHPHLEVGMSRAICKRAMPFSNHQPMFCFLEAGLTQTPSTNMPNTKPVMFAENQPDLTTILQPMVIFHADTTWFPIKIEFFL
jgi:hypothetical protein